MTLISSYSIGYEITPSFSHDFKHSNAAILSTESLECVSLNTNFPLENNRSASADIEGILKMSSAILDNIGHKSLLLYHHSMISISLESTEKGIVSRVLNGSGL